METPPSNGDGYRITLGVVYEMLQAQNQRISDLTTTVKLMDQRLNTALSDTKDLKRALDRERELREEAQQTHSDEITKLRIKVYGAITTLVLALGGLAARVGVG